MSVRILLLLFMKEGGERLCMCVRARSSWIFRLNGLSHCAYLIHSVYFPFCIFPLFFSRCWCVGQSVDTRGVLSELMSSRWNADQSEGLVCWVKLRNYLLYAEYFPQNMCTFITSSEISDQQRDKSLMILGMIIFSYMLLNADSSMHVFHPASDEWQRLPKNPAHHTL